MTAQPLPLSLQAATEKLIETLLCAKPVATYQEAKARYEADVQLQTLIREYRNALDDFRSRQASGSITQAEIDHLRELQRQVQSNDLVVEFSVHQQATAFFLSDVISGLDQLIGIDFTALASPTCC